MNHEIEQFIKRWEQLDPKFVTTYNFVRIIRGQNHYCALGYFGIHHPSMLVGQDQAIPAPALATQLIRLVRRWYPGQPGHTTIMEANNQEAGVFQFPGATPHARILCLLRAVRDGLDPKQFTSQPKPMDKITGG